MYFIFINKINILPGRRIGDFCVSSIKDVAGEIHFLIEKNVMGEWERNENWARRKDLIRKLIGEGHI